MKKNKNRPMFISVMLMLASLASVSQSFDNPGNQWNVKSSGWFYFNTEIFRFSGDTMIMNTFYNKMVATNDSASAAVWQYAGAIREWEGRVYGYMPGMFEEGLLYDFTIGAGDTSYIINDWCREPFPIVCVSTDSIDINGSTRKTFLFEFPYSQWIEGIGSLQGPLYSGIDYCVTDIYYDLLCFYNDESMLYMNPSANACYETNLGTGSVVVSNNFTIFPNPTSGLLNIGFTGQGISMPLSLVIYSSTGKPVYHSPEYLNFMKPIDLSFLSDGIYSIRLITGENIFSKKFILMH